MSTFIGGGGNTHTAVTQQYMHTPYYRPKFTMVKGKLIAVSAGGIKLLALNVDLINNFIVSILGVSGQLEDCGKTGIAIASTTLVLLWLFLFIFYTATLISKIYKNRKKKILKAYLSKKFLIHLCKVVGCLLYFPGDNIAIIASGCDDNDIIETTLAGRAVLALSLFFLRIIPSMIELCTEEEEEDAKEVLAEEETDFHDRHCKLMDIRKSTWEIIFTHIELIVDFDALYTIIVDVPNIQPQQCDLSLHLVFIVFIALCAIGLEAFSIYHIVNKCRAGKETKLISILQGTMMTILLFVLVVYPIEDNGTPLSGCFFESNKNVYITKLVLTIALLVAVFPFMCLYMFWTCHRLWNKK